MKMEKSGVLPRRGIKDNQMRGGNVPCTGQPQRMMGMLLSIQNAAIFFRDAVPKTLIRSICNI